MKYHGPLMYFSIYIPVSVLTSAEQLNVLTNIFLDSLKNLRSQKSKIIDPKHTENYGLDVRQIYR